MLLEVVYIQEVWKLLECYGRQWKVMEAYGSLWKTREQSIGKLGKHRRAGQSQV